MEIKSLIFGILALVAVCETRQLKPTVEAPARRGSWRRKASLSISVPKGPRVRSSSQPRGNKLSHSLSVNNLNLAPGQTKVITQTLVVRRRLPNANKKQTNGKKSPSSRRRGPGRRGLYAIPSSSRFNSGSGQRGAHPGQTPSSINTAPSNGLFLLSKMNPHNPVMMHRNGMATLHLPVINLGGIAPTSMHSRVPGNTGYAPNHHGNIGQASVNNFGSAHGLSNIQGGIRSGSFGSGAVSVNDLISSGVRSTDIVSALAGNPGLVVIRDHVSTPGSVPLAAGHNKNILSTTLIRTKAIQPAAFSKQGMGHSTLKSNSKSNKVVSKSHTLSPPQTTMEPGEDPPELP